MKLFALHSSREFGEGVARELGMPLSEHEEQAFPCGEHKCRPLENVRSQPVFVIQSLYTDTQQTINDKLCRLLFFIGALKDASAAAVTAVVPYLAYARQDRKADFRDPITTRYLAALFEAVGTDRLVTLEVHDIPAFQNAFRCPTEHLEARKLFADHLAGALAGRAAVVLSPDFGGVKRAEQLQQSLQKRLQQQVSLAFMEKYRKGGAVTGEALVGEVAGKTVVVVDDMISTGTTVARAAEACRKAGAAAIWVAVSHGLFSGQAPEALLAAGIDQLITTNAIPPFRLTGTALQEKNTLLDIAPLFAAAIQNIHQGGSVSALLTD